MIILSFLYSLLQCLLEGSHFCKILVYYHFLQLFMMAVGLHGSSGMHVYLNVEGVYKPGFDFVTIRLEVQEEDRARVKIGNREHVTSNRAKV